VDISKLLTGICVTLLIICIVFCTTALVSLRNAVAESEELQTEAQGLVFDLNSCLSQLEKPLKELTSNREDTAVEVGASPMSFCLREDGGTLCVYTAEGFLVQRLDVNVSTLPKKDRELLVVGISCATWQEMATLIQDYEQ